VRCAVLQPSYLPWRGFFHQIQKSDVFVFYDDVQYDKHGWRNRNRIKTADGPRWLTVPVSARGNVVNGLPINQVRIADGRWAGKHLASIRQAYARAPHIDRCLELIEPLLVEDRELLADLTIDLTVALARELGIEAEFVRSSSLGVSGERMDRLMGVLERVGATHYVSGPSARSYMDEGRLEQAGISLEYMTYDYPAYEQLHGEFEPQVSVIDLLAMEGDAASALIWGG
jgi:WbqC-like protein family